MNRRPSTNFSLKRESTARNICRQYRYSILVAKDDSFWVVLKDGWAEQHADNYRNGLVTVILLLRTAQLLPMAPEDVTWYLRKTTCLLSRYGGRALGKDWMWWRKRFLALSYGIGIFSIYSAREQHALCYSLMAIRQEIEATFWSASASEAQASVRLLRELREGRTPRT